MIWSKKVNYFWFRPLSKLFAVKRELPTAIVQLAFKIKYPSAKVVTWQKIDVSKWQVNFELNGIPYSSLYNNHGNWLETVNSISLKDTPKEVQEIFGSKYGSEGLKNIYRIKTPAKVVFELLWSNGVYDSKLLYGESGKMVGNLIC